MDELADLPEVATPVADVACNVHPAMHSKSCVWSADGSFTMVLMAIEIEERDGCWFGVRLGKQGKVHDRRKARDEHIALTGSIRQATP